jgi:predicted GNAT family acetyltransferase
MLPIHAQMAFEESGVNPLDTNPEGFRERYLRRIQKQRSWIRTEAGSVRFKAEVVSQTPQVAYLEGVWVNPANRSQGLGTTCVLQLSKHLLSRSESVCLFVNADNTSAIRFYERLGFKDRESFDTIFAAFLTFLNTTPLSHSALS